MATKINTNVLLKVNVDTCQIKHFATKAKTKEGYCRYVKSNTMPEKVNTL